MSKKSTSSQFLFTLLAATTLIVSLFIVRKSANLRTSASQGDTFTNSFDLIHGWNLISFSVEPNIPVSELCSMDSHITQVHYYNQQYYTFDCSNPTVNNFPLEAYIGYFIYSDDISSLTLAGKKAGPNYSLTEGWKSVGYAVPRSGEWRASDFCKKLGNGPIQLTEIDRWENGTWEGHVCGLDLNNFVMENNRGYFVNSVAANNNNNSNAPVPARAKPASPSI